MGPYRRQGCALQDGRVLVRLEGAEATAGADWSLKYVLLNAAAHFGQVRQCHTSTWLTVCQQSANSTEAEVALAQALAAAPCLKPCNPT